MSTATAFRIIADNEIPPDPDPAYVAARPALQALLGRAPERAHAALVYLFQKAEFDDAEKARAETVAKATISSSELYAMAKAGDYVALRILAVRGTSATEPAKARSHFSERTLALLPRMGYSPEQIQKMEADIESELVELDGQSAEIGPDDPTLLAMAAKAGITPEDIQKFSGEAAGRTS